MAEFFAMGGYGFYVWGAYAVAVAALIGNAATAYWRTRSAQRQVRTEDA